MTPSTTPQEKSVTRTALEVIDALGGGDVGCVSASGQVLRVPKACLELCLNGCAEDLHTRGCAWLCAQAIVGGADVPSVIECEQGKHAEVIQLPGGDALRLIRVCEPSPSTAEPAVTIEARLNEAEAGVERAARLLLAREEENLRFADEILQCYEQLNVLYDISIAFSRSTNIRELKRAALIRIAQMLRATHAMYFDENGDLTGIYKISAQSHRESGYELSSERVTEQVAAVLQSGVSRAVQEQGDERIDSIPGPLLLVPLETADSIIGVVGFSRPRGEAPFLIGEQSMAETMLRHAALNIQLFHLFDDLNQMSVDVVRAMVTAIDAKDNYTGGHSERVAQLSRVLGEHLNLAANELQVLEWGARLHDIGKIGTRDSVLGKTGPLTPEEFDHIKQHPVTSYEVLQPIHHLAPVLDGVRHHHEAWNGTGYPDGLAGEEIPLFARIIQTADVFDALTSTRSYRAAYTVEGALEIMRKEAGVRLDPKMIAVFEEVIENIRQTRPEMLRHIATAADQDDPGDDGDVDDGKEASP